MTIRTDALGVYNDDPREEYQFSQCAEEAIRFHWPDHLTENHPLFERRMKELQIALIECKMPIMMPSDKRRALNTVRTLKHEMKKV